MKNTRKIILLQVILPVIFVACNKYNETFTITSQQVAHAPLPTILNYQCTNAPDYGDSIIYLKPSKNDQIIHPVNGSILGKGIYFSWPQGLIIDSTSGAINLSASETGLRYIVGFVKAGTRDTCLENIIIGGVTYIDSIYVLSNNDTLAIPYYNANAATPAVCDGSDDNDYPDDRGHGNGNDRCIFDGKDKHGKKGQANAKKVKVRTISGVINLKATLEANAFGNNPANGTSIDVPIVYNLSDKSDKATQQVDVKLVYYEKRSDIPTSLVNSVGINRTTFFKNETILSSPRPPIIIIVRYSF